MISRSIRVVLGLALVSPTLVGSLLAQSPSDSPRKATVASRTTKTKAAVAVTPVAPIAFGVDERSSRVLVKVGAEGYGHVHGVLGRLTSGKVALNGPGELVFDMRSFVADPVDVRQQLGLTKKVSRSDADKTTANMLSADVLNVNRFPTATYVISKVTPSDGQASGAPGRYQFDGDFTLHGSRRPLRLATTVEATNQPGVLRMRGTFAILQSHYGMTPYSALGGFVRVADRLEITGDLVLRPDSP